MIDLKEVIKNEAFYVNFPLEVRFTAKDDIFLSTCEGPADQCWIGVVMYRPYLKDPPQYKALFQGFENIMAAYDGRPHWAKAFDKEKFSILKLYPRTAEKFLEIRKKMDPEGLFLN